MRGRIAFLALLVLTGCARGRIIPHADHHQHLMSDAAVLQVSAPGRQPPGGVVRHAVGDPDGLLLEGENVGVELERVPAVAMLDE